jgi:hypothetical protein
MKTNHISKRLRATATILSLVAMPIASQAAGTIIIEDNFDRTGLLVGSLADSGQTWTGTSTFENNGAEYQVDGSSSSYADIGGLTFETSSSYCLTVDITIYDPFSDGWLGFGFSSPTSTDAFTDTVGTFIRLDDPEVRTYVNGGSLEQIDVVTDNFSDTLTIFLDTGATLATSTLSWEINGDPVRTGISVDATGIDGIFLAHDTVDDMSRSVFDRLQLLGPVPEPSSALLLVLAGVGTILRRKR